MSFRSSVGKTTGAWLLSPLLYKVELRVVFERVSAHPGTMMIWMKQMKTKTREAQATYAPNLESTSLEYCRREQEETSTPFYHWGQRRASSSELFAPWWLPVTYNYVTFWQRVGLHAHLFLQVRLPEGEQEPLDVLRAQTVDAACVDGPAQELVHFVLWVQVFLRVSENEMPGGHKTRWCLCLRRANKISRVRWTKEHSVIDDGWMKQIRYCT